MRADIIGHFKPCITDIYLHIDARMADYILPLVLVLVPMFACSVVRNTAPWYHRSILSGGGSNVRRR